MSQEPRRSIQRLCLCGLPLWVQSDDSCPGRALGCYTSLYIVHRMLFQYIVAVETQVATSFAVVTAVSVALLGSQEV